MKAFLQRFAALVAGVLQGFDRLVFKGKLVQLYLPEAMHCYLALNRIPRKGFKAHAAEITEKILKSPVVEQAKELQRYRFLPARLFRGQADQALGGSQFSEDVQPCQRAPHGDDD